MELLMPSQNVQSKFQLEIAQELGYSDFKFYTMKNNREYLFKMIEDKQS